MAGDLRRVQFASGLDDRQMGLIMGVAGASGWRRLLVSTVVRSAPITVRGALTALVDAMRECGPCGPGEMRVRLLRRGVSGLSRFDAIRVGTLESVPTVHDAVD